MFRQEDCIIPEIWCGESNVAPKKKGKRYYKTGSRYECLKKGFGSGSNAERLNNLPANSLQRIKYVGEKHEKKFIEAGIKTVKQLITYTSPKTPTQIQSLLKNILTKTNGILDTKAYNSTILYLHRHGISNVPKCKKIR